MGRYQPRNMITLNQSAPPFDGFGRLRIGEPLTLFDSKLQYGKNELFWDEATVSGSGFTSTFLSDESAVQIASDGTPGQFVRQTFQRFNYQPGKSQAVTLTGVLDSGALDPGIFQVVTRSDTSGSPVDKVVNSDDFNGSQNPEGYGSSLRDFEPALDFTKSQIFTIDFEWLGVGQARMGVVRDGQPYIMHYFRNDNISDKVYMRTPNLPLRYEVEVTAEKIYKRLGYFDDNNGLFFQYEQENTGACSLKAICSTVISEGGQTDSGTLRYITTGTTALDATVAGTTYAVLGARIASAELGSIVKLVDKSILGTTGDSFEWFIVYNPTIAGSVTWIPLANSSIEYFVGVPANTVTGGITTTGGFVYQRTAEQSQLTNQLRIGHTINGTPQVVTLCVRSLTNGLDVHGSLTVREEE